MEARAAGFKNISIDLIHSLPNQNLEQWRSELQQAIKLGPEHISIYGLTIEEDTPFAHIYPADSQKLADEDLSADMFELADKVLRESGFEHYEIASYAKPGYRSQHNSGYWKRDGYLGLGVAAHSFLRSGYGVRFNNSNNMKEYRQSVTTGQLQHYDESALTQRDAMAEYMFLGLRLSDGVNATAFKDEFGQSPESVYGTKIDRLVELGLLVKNNSNLTLTLRGMLLSNQVFTSFLT
jgi:oxygen-independent coproporphyrinogen-3 oxidase